MKKKQRRSFTQEFKIEAVKLVESSDKSMEQIARELDVTTTMLYNWRKKYKSSDLSSKNDSSLTAEQRIKQLELENARLREEREILKKAAVGSSGQRNSYHRLLICCGDFNETNIYTRRERARF